MYAHDAQLPCAQLACRAHALSNAIARSIAGAEGFLVLRLFKPLPHTGENVQLSGVQGTAQTRFWLQAWSPKPLETRAATNALLLLRQRRRLLLLLLLLRLASKSLAHCCFTFTVRWRPLTSLRVPLHTYGCVDTDAQTPVAYF